MMDNGYLPLDEIKTNHPEAYSALLRLETWDSLEQGAECLEPEESEKCLALVESRKNKRYIVDAVAKEQYTFCHQLGNVTDEERLYLHTDKFYNDPSIEFVLYSAGERIMPHHKPLKRSRWVSIERLCALKHPDYQALWPSA